MFKSFKIITLIFSILFFTNNSYADQKSMSERVMPNVELAVLNDSFTFDQLNEEAQMLIKSGFGRSNVEKVLDMKFFNQAEYEVNVHNFLYYFQKDKNGYKIRFIGVNDRGVPKEGIALDNKMPRLFVTKEVVRTLEYKHNDSVTKQVSVSTTTKELSAAQSRAIASANASLEE